MQRTVCNMCGKEFDLWDTQEGFGLDYHVGYGSKYDGEHIHIDLCCDCFDEMMDSYILHKCMISPLEKEEAE